MPDRQIDYGEDATDATYRSGDAGGTAGGGNFVVAEDLDAGTVLLEYDQTAGEWVSRGDVNLDGNGLTTGALNGADIQNAAADTVPIAQGDGSLAMGLLETADVVTETFTSSGTWTKPDGALAVTVHIVAAGGGGGGGSISSGGGGGEGMLAQLNPTDLPQSVDAVVGSGGGGTGGDSVFGPLTVRGGEGSAEFGPPGDGGGKHALADSNASKGESAAGAGAGGAGQNESGAGAFEGGNAIFGGGGGAGANNGSATSGGGSVYAGDGGDDSGGVQTDGFVPGGGGSGTGNGARGEVKVWTVTK